MVQLICNMFILLQIPLGNISKIIELLITKSTVPVGTCDQVEKIIQERLTAREKKRVFDVASNPEFLREGAAIEDFMNSDRIVVGDKK